MSTVDTSTSYTAVQFGFQRTGFYAEGRFWAFYHDGTNAVYESTVNPAVWAGGVTSIGVCDDGTQFSVWFDGTYVHYVRYDDVTYDLFYRRGDLENDGTITWSAVEQQVYDGEGEDDHYECPCISVDSGGYAWIGALRRTIPDDTPYALKNANNDGTWALDFATQLNATDSLNWKVCPVPLTSAKVYMIYCRAGNPPYGKLYDAGWGAEETDLGDYNINQGYRFSAVADEDNVHIVYAKETPKQIRHNKRVFGVGWDANDVLVQDAITSWCAPVLSIDTATGDLYCFWTSNVTDHVYYRRYTGAAWHGLVDWIDETVDDIDYDEFISSYYQDYGGYIGLLYLTETASPYKVRFEFLDLPLPPGMEQVLFGGWYDLLDPTLTEYAPLATGYNWSTTEGWRAKLVSTNGVIKQLRVKLYDAAGNPASPGVGKHYTFTVMLNGNPTALTFDIADAATSGSNMVNEIIVTGGDIVSLQCTPDGTPTAVYAAWTSVFESDNFNESIIMGGGGAGLEPTAIEYGQVMGGYTSYSGIENDFRQVIPTAGTLKDFYVRLSIDPGTAPDAYRFTVRLNGATVAQSLIVTITANDITGSDFVHNLPVVAGDVITMMIEPLNLPSATPFAMWGMTFVADINGESITIGGVRSNLDPAATEYMTLSGWGGRSWIATEDDRYQLGQVCTLKKLHVLLSAPPGAGNDYDFALRIAGTNVVTLQISDANITGDSGVLSDTVALDEYVNLRVIPTSSPNVADAYWGFVCYIAPGPPVGQPYISRVQRISGMRSWGGIR